MESALYVIHTIVVSESEICLWNGFDSDAELFMYRT